MSDILRLILFASGTYLVYRLKWPKLIIVALILIDLLPMSFRVIKPVEPTPVFQSKKFMDDKSLYRVWVFDQNIATSLMYWGVQVVNGYHPAKTRIIQEYFEKGASGKSPNMLSIKYIVHEGKIYPNMDFLPRAWFVKEIAIGTKEQIYDAIQDTTWDPLYTAMLSDDINWDDYNGHVDSLWFSPDEIILKITGGGFLVLSEIYFPHWKCYLDGKDTKIYKVNNLIRGVIVPLGVKEIRFRYEPDFTLGKSITLAGWGIILILLIWGLWGKK